MRQPKLTVELVCDVVARAPDAVVIIDSWGKVAAANPAAAALWHSRSGLTGEPSDSLIARGHREQFAEIRARCGSQPAAHAATLMGLRADGAEFPLEVRMQQLVLDEGMYLWATLRSAAVAEVIEILANSAHDLRGSLNSVIGFAEFVGDEKPGPLNALQKEYLADILSGGRAQLRLIDAVIQLVRIESGRLELHAGRFDLGEALQSVQLALLPAAAARGARLHLECERAMVSLDRDKLSRVVTSLATDSLELAGENGRVWLVGRCASESGIELTICAAKQGTDTDSVPGLAGIDSVDEKWVETGGALYLSLASTRRLVAFLGGRLTVGNTADLRTILYSISLPMLETFGTCAKE